MANVETLLADTRYFAEVAAPSTPASGGAVLYVKTDGKLYLKNDAGTEYDCTGSSGIAATLFDARGDLIVASAADTAARLAIGTVGKRLYSDGTDPSWVGFIGCKASHSTTESFAAAANRAMLLDTDLYDTHNFHFTSAAALTGTVAKTAASPNIVGTGTSFTTELTVNQVISIPGTATEVGVIKAITDNTNLELWAAMANNATGQTATRRNEYMAIPTGFPTNGKWRVGGGTYWQAYTGSAVSYAIVDHFPVGTDNSGLNRTFVGCLGYQATGTSVVQASPGDYFDIRALNGSSATQLLGTAGTNDAATFLGIEFVGA